MSYRFYAEYLKPIGSKVGTAGTDTVIPIQGHEGLRLTIPRLSVSCGATPQTLTILQVEDMDQVAAFDVGAETITIESIDADLADKHIAIEKEDGTFFFTTVSATAAKVQTLIEAPAGRYQADRQGLYLLRHRQRTGPDRSTCCEFR